MSTIDSSSDIRSNILDRYGSSSTATSETDKKKSNDELGKNQFLQLLVTQLQYQDPMEPASDTEFIAQMAQFSALEQMQNLNTTFSISQANSLIDKFVSATKENETTGKQVPVEGMVEAVQLVNGEPYLVIGEDLIKMSDVKGVLNNLSSETLSTRTAIKAVEDKIADLEDILKQLAGITDGEDDGDGTGDGNTDGEGDSED